MAETIVIFINGPGTHGKDEFVTQVSYLAPAKYNIVNYSTIDRVKDIAGFMGCPRDHKSDRDRQLWSDIKDAWIKYNNGPAVRAIKMVRDTHSPINYDHSYRHNIIFIHCREIEQIKYMDTELSKTFDTYKLLVLRPHNNKSPLTTKDKVDLFDKTDYDFVVSAQTIRELRNYAQDFINLITGLDAKCTTRTSDIPHCR